MYEILSYDKIFRLSSAQCLHPCVKPLIGGGVAASRNSSAKVAPHKIDYLFNKAMYVRLSVSE